MSALLGQLGDSTLPGQRAFVPREKHPYAVLAVGYEV